MDFPNPLTSADCDLRDFQYMPLDVLRLRDSDIAARTTGEEFRCAVLLWCAAWHQVPAASLPDDDVNLAQYAGYGRAVNQWRDVREGALRGWIKCADGRLYHPVVAEKANESWNAKHRMAYDKLVERIRKRNKARAERNLAPLELPHLDQWIDMGRPLEKILFPEEFSPVSTGTLTASSGSAGDFHRKASQIPPENSLKGEERRGTEGTLKNIGTNDGIARASRATSNDALPPVEISKSLIGWERDRNKAARGISSSTPQVIDLAEMHVTLDELRRAYDAAVADRQATNDITPINAGFVRMFVEKHRNPPKPRPKADEWHRTDEGTDRKARELGMQARPGELYPALRERIWAELRRREQQGVAA